MRGLPLLIAAGFAGMASQGLAHARPIWVSADPALRAPLELFVKKYQASHPSIHIRFVWSGKAEVGEGKSSPDSVDVVVSAGAKPPSSIGVKAERPRIVARSVLAIVVPEKDGHVHGLTDLVDADKVLTTMEGERGFGYVREMLDRAAQAYGRGWLGIVEERLVKEASDSPAVVEAIADGDAVAGFAYAANIQENLEVKRIPIPAGLNPIVSFNAVVVKRSTSRREAEEWVEALLEPTFQQILVRSGFESPLTAPEELTVLSDGQALRLFVKNMRTMRQARLTVDGDTFSGTDLRAILNKATGERVRITGADGLSVDVALSSIRRLGAVLMPMTGGNLRVILPGQPRSRWVRWVRRIEVL